MCTGKFVQITMDRMGAEKRVEHAIWNTRQRTLRNLKIPGIAVRRRANRELSVQKATAEPNFFQWNSDLNMGDIVIDGNESLAPSPATLGNQLVNIVGGQLDSISGRGHGGSWCRLENRRH